MIFTMCRINLYTAYHLLIFLNPFRVKIWALFCEFSSDASLRALPNINWVHDGLFINFFHFLRVTEMVGNFVDASEFTETLWKSSNCVFKCFSLVVVNLLEMISILTHLNGSTRRAFTHLSKFKNISPLKIYGWIILSRDDFIIIILILIGFITKFNNSNLKYLFNENHQRNLKFYSINCSWKFTSCPWSGSGSFWV